MESSSWKTHGGGWEKVRTSHIEKAENLNVCSKHDVQYLHRHRVPHSHHIPSNSSKERKGEERLSGASQRQCSWLLLLLLALSSTINTSTVLVFARKSSIPSTSIFDLGHTHTTNRLIDLRVVSKVGQKLLPAGCQWLSRLRE
jgi:hypothetical protein